MLFVSDAFNHRVQVFNLVRDTQNMLIDATFRVASGSYGSGENQFNQPGRIVKNADGRIYVLDVLNSRIQTLNDTFSSASVVPILQGKIDILAEPVNFAFSESEQQIYLVDSYQHRVKIISMKSNLVDELGVRKIEGRKRQS